MSTAGSVGVLPDKLLLWPAAALGGMALCCSTEPAGMCCCAAFLRNSWRDSCTVVPLHVLQRASGSLTVLFCCL